MRSFSTAIQNYLAAGTAISVHQLVYFWAVNRSTDIMEEIGFWTGAEDVTLTVDGGSRDYIGRGVFQGTEPITHEIGLNINTARMQIAAPSEDAEDLVKGYSLRFATVEIHTAFFNTETRAMIDAPVRDFIGMISRVDFPTAAPGQMSYAVIEAESNARLLSKKLSGKKSHQTHKANGGDQFRKYGDISGNVPVAWGEATVEAASSTTPTPPSRTVKAEPMWQPPKGR